MNVLDPKKERELYRLFAFGHGIRESAKLAGVNRGTASRYHKAWLRVRFRLQQAYDAMWEHDCTLCDEITASLPDEAVNAMFEAWWNDDEEKQTVKSGFFDGYEGPPPETEATAGENENPQPREVQGEPQEPAWPDGWLSAAR
jgi:hypothetical protein